MKGVISAENLETGEIEITGDDTRCYRLLSSGWKSNCRATIGAKVDFIPDGYSAKEAHLFSSAQEPGAPRRKWPGSGRGTVELLAVIITVSIFIIIVSHPQTKPVSESNRFTVQTGTTQHLDATTGVQNTESTSVKPLQVFKMKGFYLGMPMEEARSNLNSLRLGSRNYDAHTLICPIDPFFKLTFDSDNRLTSLQADEGHIIDALFNVTDLSVKEFAQEFADGYGLPEMEPLDPSTGKVGWSYQDKDRGFAVIIFSVNGAKRLWLRASQTPQFN
jgi:hypothetical protein